MNLTKALTMLLIIGAELMAGTVLISGCHFTKAVETDSEPGGGHKSIIGIDYISKNDYNR